MPKKIKLTAVIEADDNADKGDKDTRKELLLQPQR